MPVDCGSITASSAEAATAASAAVPPERSTSMAVSAASGWDVATMAFWEWTVERPAKWKLLMRNGSFVVAFLYLTGPRADGLRGLLCEVTLQGTWHIQYHLCNA